MTILKFFVSLLCWCSLALAMINTGHPASSDPFIAKELNRLEEIDKIGQPLFINTFLGKTEEVREMLQGFPEYLSSILDCNQAFKCPLEIAIMRGHLEIANLLLTHMKVHIKHTCIEDLFLRWNSPMIHTMIVRGDKPAVNYILETIMKENPDGDGLETKFGGMTALYYAKSVKNNEMVAYLTELGCKDEIAKKSMDYSSMASSDSPRKGRPDSLLTSSGSPRKSSSGHLTPPTKSNSGSKRRLSSPRLNIDLRFRSRSSSLTASGSPRKAPSKSPAKSPRESSNSPREKSGSRSASRSAPESPKNSDATSDELDGSSRVDSDAGSSSSSSDSIVIKKKSSGSLRKISPRFKPSKK